MIKRSKMILPIIDKKYFFVGLYLFFGTIGFSQMSEREKEKEVFKEIKENFKEEKLWYRIWNRYDINPGFSKYAIGYSKSMPLLGWDNVRDKGGMHYRKKHLEFGMSFWEGDFKDELSITDASRISVGYFTPLSFFSFGRRYLDVKGFLAQPALGLGYSYDNKKHGLYVAPSFHIQLPFAIIEARANIEYTFGGGLNVFPEISLQLDALMDLLDPNKIKTGKYNSSSTTRTPIGGGWERVTTTRTSTDFHINNIGPLWGITPRIGFAPELFSHTPYKTYGIGISGRVSFIGADIRVDRGFLKSSLSAHEDLDATVKTKFDVDQIKGLIPANLVTVELNVNIAGVFLNLFKKAAIRGMGKNVTPLNRFNFHLGLTHISPGTPKYDDEANAIAYTDAFFAEYPDIERNATNDPMQHNKEWAVNYGLSYEMGVVGMRANSILSRTSGLSSTFEVYYIIPIVKVIKAYTGKL